MRRWSIYGSSLSRSLDLIREDRWTGHGDALNAQDKGLLQYVGLWCLCVVCGSFPVAQLAVGVSSRASAGRWISLRKPRKRHGTGAGYRRSAP